MSRKHSGAYQHAWKKGWLDRLFYYHPNNGRILKNWDIFEAVENAAAECASRGDFQKRYSGAYKSAAKNGWLDKLFPPRKPNKWSTIEAVQKLANKCQFRTELAKLSPGAYGAAIRNGWIDQVFFQHPNQGRAIEELGTWDDYENVLTAAKECKDRAEFAETHSGAYAAALRNGWLDEVFADHESHGFSTSPWTEERLYELARKCGKRRVLETRFPGAYSRAKTLGILDDLFAGEENQGYSRTPNNYWTKVLCASEAAKFQSRTAFWLGARAAAAAAFKNGWLEEICSHMPRVGSRQRRAVYGITCASDKEIYIGLSANPDRRYKSHLRSGEEHVLELLSKPHELVLLSEFLPKYDAAQLERTLIEEYISDGWKVANSNSGGSLGGVHWKWTKEKVAELAEQCSDRTELRECSPQAYAAAHKYDWIDEVFAHHENCGYRRVAPGTWTLESLIEEAAKYETRNEMQKHAKSAFNAAHRMGVIDEIFASHTNLGYSRAPPNHYSFERLSNLTNECSNRQEFQEKHPSAYNAAININALDQLFSEHENQGYAIGRKRPGGWCVEELKAIASAFPTRGEMQKHAGSAYLWAQRHGLLDELFCNHENLGYATPGRRRRAEREKKRGGSTATKKSSKY